LGSDVKHVVDPAQGSQGRAGRRRLIQAAGLVSALTMTSRVLGLVRETAFAALLGTTVHGDAFRIAFRFPNMLRDLFAEGALSAAFVPTYSKVLNEEGRERANQLVGRVITLLLVIVSGLLVAAYVGARPLVGELAPGFRDIPGKLDMTADLTRVTFVFLPFVSLSAVAMGMLNAEHRFGLPAFAPAVFNLVAIIWAGGLWWSGASPAGVAFGWAIGVVLGGVAQLVIQLPALGRQGFRLRLSWSPRDPGVVRILRLMAPATIGLAAIQINVVVNSRFASWEPGAVSWLEFAFRLLHLPIGVFGVALGTIAGAGLARRAAHGDMDGFRETLRDSLRLVWFVAIPATLGLVVLREPIVRLIYERRRFTAEDTLATAAALGLYAIGLVGYTAVKVLAPAFYALNQSRTPLLGSLAAVGTNLVLVVFLNPLFGFRAIALAMAVGALVNASVLLIAFERREGGLRGQGLGGGGLMMGLAAIPMGIAVWGSEAGLSAWLGDTSLPARLAGTLLPIVLGVMVYAATSMALGVPEVRRIVSMIRERRASLPTGQDPESNARTRSGGDA